MRPQAVLRTVYRRTPQLLHTTQPNRAICIARWSSTLFIQFFFPSRRHFPTLPSALEPSRGTVKWNICFGNGDKTSSVSFLVWVASFEFQLLLRIPGLPGFSPKCFKNGASHSYLPSEIFSAQSQGLCRFSVDGFVYCSSLHTATQIF